jgi:hypothetical protein
MNNQNLVQNQTTFCEVEPKICPMKIESHEIVCDKDKIKEAQKKSRLGKIPRVKHSVLP